VADKTIVPKIDMVSITAPVGDASSASAPVAETSGVPDPAKISAVSQPVDETSAVSVDHHPIDQPLMGSSRTFGGFSRGLAQGNVPNHADLPTSNFVRPIKGEVSLYVTDQYPRHINFEQLKGESEMVAMVEASDSMTLVLEKVAGKFAIIKSSSTFLVIYGLILKFNPDPDYSIYYRKSLKWIALGSFDHAIEEDDDCYWGTSGATPELHLLIVRAFLLLSFHQLI
jgi:hypothetical protein